MPGPAEVPTITMDVTALGTDRNAMNREAKQVAPPSAASALSDFLRGCLGHERFCCDTVAAPAPDYESGGRRFESFRARQQKRILCSLLVATLPFGRERSATRRSGRSRGPTFKPPLEAVKT